MLARTSQFEAVDVEDAQHSKASDGDAFIPVHFGGPSSPLQENTLQFSPSLHLGDSFRHQYNGNHFSEYSMDNAQCIDFIQDPFRFNGESPGHGSWSRLSTPSLIASGLSNLRTLDEASPPCTPSMFDGVSGPTTSTSTNIPLPDVFDGLEDPPLHNLYALPSSPSLPLSAPLPSPIRLSSRPRSTARSQMCPDPPSTPSLLFSSSDDLETGECVKDNVGDGYEAGNGYEAPQLVIAHFDSSSYGSQSAHSYGWDAPPYSAPPYAKRDLLPEDSIYPSPHTHPHSAPSSGCHSAPPGIVGLPSDGVEATRHYTSYLSRQSSNEVNSFDDCLMQATPHETTGQPLCSLTCWQPVGALDVPMSSTSYVSGAATSIMGNGQGYNAHPSINSRFPIISVVSPTGYLGDAETSTMGDRQTYRAVPFTHSRFRAPPHTPLNTSMGDSGRQHSKMISRAARKGVSSKKMSRTANDGLSYRSPSMISSPLTTSSWGSPASALEGGESESVYQSIPPMIHQIGSPNVSAASELRRKHEGAYKCELEQCGATFTTRHNLNHHKNRHMGVVHFCSKCEAPFAHRTSKDRHEKKCKQPKPDA